MKKTRQFFSVLLTLAMLLSLLTTTALAAYPNDVRVYNANKKLISLGDGECLTANDATGASSYTGGSSYVARYDKSSGTLYLKDYQGVAADGMIFANGDLNIAVESNSSFITSVSATNNLYGIQAGGKLNISGSGKLTVTANGNGNVYGIYADEGVTISAPLDVRVGKVDSTKNGPVYGIYTEGGAISLSGAEDKTITATGGKGLAYGVYAADNSNITISGKLTVSPSDGTFNYGIYTGSGSTITLDAATLSIQSGFDCGIYNNNGNVVIKNSPDVTLNSDKSSRYGIWTNYGGDLTIENSTVKVSANGFPADIKGNVSIQNSTVELTLTGDNYEVIRTGNSTTANTIDLSGSGSVTLTAPGKQEYAMISGKVTATSGTKVEKGTYNSEWKNYKGEYDSANNKTVLKFVHETTAPAATVADVTITGTTGTAIADKEVIITLANDTFASTLSGSWITNLPAGLSQSVSRTDDTHAKITVSGNPSAVSSDALIIKIPAASLASGSDLDVTGNANAKYNIKASVAALGGSAGITGTAKYNEILTADTSAITGNTGTFLYQWKRNGTDIPSAVNSTYKIVTEDIGKTITVAVSSSVESGTIVSPATATVGKADTPSAPTGLSGMKGKTLATVPLTGGWAWVDDTTVMNTAGTQTFKANYTDTTGNYENATNVDVTVEVIDKTNVSASITFADGELTYNGAGQAYETASISGITAGANPGWTYAYVPSGTGSLDASGKPQNAGTYTVTATYEDDDNYGTKSAVLKIKKAVPTGTPKYTEITTAGKTLADAAITTTGADFSVPGAVIWVADDGVTPLPDTTVVAANTYYKWLFTPTDTDNYETLTGTIRLYRRSSGGGGGGRSTSRYTVSFESNGGSKVSNQTVTRNSVMKEPTAPTKENFDFDGWYSDKELKTKYDFSAKVTKSFTLYAKWTEKDNSVNQIILTIGKKNAQVFGKAKSNDVAPKIEKDRTMLPARFVAENLGAKVEWDGEKELVTITGKNLKTDENVTILITIGSATVKVNGKEIKLDSPAFIENDRTYTPIRFISEELGASVEWVEKDQKVIITKPEIKKAETK